MRDLACDVAKGLAFLEMEYANHSSVLTHTPPGQNGLTFADTIFPQFVFLSGLHLSTPQRSIQTLGLGLAYNVIKSSGLGFRPFGVLQRIGAASALVSLSPNFRSLKSCSFPLFLLAVWMGLSYKMCETRKLPFKSLETSAQTRIDSWVIMKANQFLEKVNSRLNANWHLKLYRPEIDPEGLLGVLTTAISLWFGAWVSSNDLSVNESMLTGASLLSFGFLFSYAFPKTCPINKPYWTLSYMLSTSGISLAKYTIVTELVKHAPNLVVDTLSTIGRLSLPLYFVSALVDLSPVRSWLARATGKSHIGEFASQTILNSILSGVAYIWSTRNIRLRLL